MKRVLIVTFASLMGLSSAWAGDKKDGWSEESMRQRHEKKVERMKKNLGLSSDQEMKIQAILDGKKEKRKAIHDQMKALHDETHAEIRAVLTPEQRAKFDKNKKEGHMRSPVKKREPSK